MLPVACGSSPLEDHASLGFYGTPDEIIKKLEQTNKDAGQYFMLGQAFKDQKQHKKALLYFANSCFASHKNEQLTLYPMPVYSYVTSFRRKSAYYEDALYEIALIMYSYQEYGYTEKFLKKIGKSNLGLHVDAQILLSRALQAQKKEDEAFDILSDEISAAPNNPTLLKLLIRRASLYESIDDYGMAAADYSLIIEKDMKSWQAGLSAANLYRLAGKAGLDTNETLLLAKGLYIAKKHKEAQDILTSLKKDEQADKKTVNEYTLRVLTNLGPDAEAQKAAKEIPDGQQIMADELWLSGKRDKAVQVYRDTLKNNVTEKALYRTALYMSDRNRSGYSSFLELYIKNFPDAENAGQMLWLLARSRIENGQTNEAEKLLGK
ncbi:MAG: hypothetical protein LBT84_04835 [Spirochaetia bacterium]|jgi:hypothetical protein|nr:hypothetical protein [Spirochaetia bacterium]